MEESVLAVEIRRRKGTPFNLLLRIGVSALSDGRPESSRNTRDGLNNRAVCRWCTMHSAALSSKQPKLLFFFFLRRARFNTTPHFILGAIGRVETAAAVMSGSNGLSRLRSKRRFMWLAKQRAGSCESE